MLSWAGGQPLFRVYRGIDPASLVDPGNLIAEVSAREWTDMPPAAHLFEVEARAVHGNEAAPDGDRTRGGECDRTPQEPEKNRKRKPAVPAPHGGSLPRHPVATQLTHTFGTSSSSNGG